ncbi:hypothetical protein Y032_0720g1813 [Ancylostoma ceylanicum]|uniref:Uncharacterized protein n=1 Tax=Ancylostoma ceylanicum TaxID=53326 RepID=A0A016WFG9_9BILA|nr:hypothetical protein Y032_0720g1813 [Ancylostoma ceylanicum]
MAMDLFNKETNEMSRRFCGVGLNRYMIFKTPNCARCAPAGRSQHVLGGIENVLRDATCCYRPQIRRMGGDLRVPAAVQPPECPSMHELLVIQVKYEKISQFPLHAV